VRFLIVPALLLLFSVQGLAQDAAAPTTPVIVTIGDASVMRAPDQAFVTVAVETRAKNARDAGRQNAEAMAVLQQRILAAGVPKDAMRTVGYSIEQQYDFSDGRRIPREFLARNALEIRLDEVGKVGDVLDVAIQSGANSITGVRFDLKDRSKAEQEALRLAVIDARGRAVAAASGAGATIDRVLKIEEARDVIFPRFAAAEAVRTAAAPTPIEPGVIEIRAHVTMTVAIK
jgi:uncharacterized protein YggE